MRGSRNNSIDTAQISNRGDAAETNNLGEAFWRSALWKGQVSRKEKSRGSQRAQPVLPARPGPEDHRKLKKNCSGMPKKTCQQSPPAEDPGLLGGGKKKEKQGGKRSPRGHC